MSEPTRRPRLHRNAKVPAAAAHPDSSRSPRLEYHLPAQPAASPSLPIIKRPVSPLWPNNPKKRKIKAESPESSPPQQPRGPLSLHGKKLLSYTKYNRQSPFPSYPRPTPEQVKTAISILTSLHGPRRRPNPAELVAPANRSGCGDSPSVLDALVRTILSQNTSDANSSRAKQSMDAVYGRSDNWDAIVEGGRQKLENAIRCGGLGAVKSRVIMEVLQQVKMVHGEYSLETLRQLGNDDVMRELLSFKGVGPKTASCVMLFSLGRESFAVDTHVWRISGLLGWRPQKATRDETHLHLDARVPDEDKYALHRLLVTHGKVCAECKAGGRDRGKCPLRRASRNQNVEARD